MLVVPAGHFQTGSSQDLAGAPNEWATYLAQMHNAHDQLLQAMSDMAAVTESPMPERGRYTQARWRLSKASTALRALWDELYPKIYRHSQGQEASALAAIDASNMELRGLSSAHIRRWSTEAIDADWPAYCEASRNIRWKMMAIVRHQRRHVIPTLHRLGQL